MHAALPEEDLYLPAAHAAHGPPSGPVFPTSHSQTEEPQEDTVFDAQVKHSIPSALYSPG